MAGSSLLGHPLTMVGIAFSGVAGARILRLGVDRPTAGAENRRLLGGGGGGVFFRTSSLMDEDRVGKGSGSQTGEGQRLSATWGGTGAGRRSRISLACGEGSKLIL